MPQVTRIDNRRDILLLLLYSPGTLDSVNEPIVGRTRLVKMLFLFKQEALPEFRKGTAITEDNFYDFFPWSFGPFSSQVYDDLNFFVLRGLIKEQDSEQDTLPQSVAEWEHWLSGATVREDDSSIVDYTEQAFCLTDKGIDIASSLYRQLSPSQRGLLRTFKKKLIQASLRAVLEYVYKSYPDFTARSEIKQRILRSG